MILTLTSAHLSGRSRARLVESLVDETPGAVEAGPGQRAIGMVLTGGYEPRPEVLRAIGQAGMFACFVEDDTYTVASEVHDLLVKTHAADAEKIELIKALVWEHLQLDPVLAAAAEATFDPA